MSKHDKYMGLFNYFKSKSIKIIMLNFAEIEKLIGYELPSSAYKHRAFWANTRTHLVAFGWLDAGYRTADVDFFNQQVEFRKNTI